MCFLESKLAPITMLSGQRGPKTSECGDASSQLKPYVRIANATEADAYPKAAANPVPQLQRRLNQIRLAEGTRTGGRWLVVQQDER
ncbi:hypothetical protein B0T21DRAFT_367474, partial [Apiosordaria backusii]